MRVLICGSTGYGNIGDDEMRNILVAFLRQYFPDLEIVVTRPYPQETLVKNADFVIIGGGGLIYDWNQANFDYFSDYIVYAVRHKKPVVLIGVGEQGIKSEENLLRLKLLSNYIPLITVRQESDRKFFIDAVGIKSLERIWVAHDLAYLSKPALVTFTPPSKKSKVMIIPGSNYNIDILASMQQFIRERKNKYDFYTTVTSYEDQSWLNKLANSIAKKERGTRDFTFFTAPYIAALLGEMDYVVTSRFHGIVFAVNGGCKKILGLNKSKKIVEELPPENIIPYTLGFEPEILEEMMLNCTEIQPPDDASMHLSVLKQFIELFLKNANSRKDN